MSRTKPGKFRGVSFWVYDVSAALLMAEIAEAAERLADEDDTAWLTDTIKDLRINAAISDFFMPMDEWARGHEDTFLALVATACRRLSERGSVTAAEAAGWMMTDDLPIMWRGDKQPTEPAVEFGHALLDMARGRYPAAPTGTRWYFGWPGGVRTIPVATA